MPPSLVKKTMARLYQTRTFFGLWTYSRLYGCAKAQICYFPGTTASEDIASQQYPCDPYAYTTLCCPLGWTCFSNHLCVVTDEAAVGGDYSVGTALRGACTNPLWNDSVCGNFCLGVYPPSSHDQTLQCNQLIVWQTIWMTDHYSLAEAAIGAVNLPSVQEPATATAGRGHSR